MKRAIGPAILATLVLAACFEREAVSPAPSSKAVDGKAMGSKAREVLQAQAIRDLHESKFSGAKSQGGLCDKVTDEQYVTTYGTASPDVMGTRRTLPAAIVRHHFTCVINAMATKDRYEQWVILALDSEFDTVRCLRTGPPHLIVGLYTECQFKADDGKSPFPPPQQVEEIWRKDYAQALAALDAALPPIALAASIASPVPAAPTQLVPPPPVANVAPSVASDSPALPAPAAGSMASAGEKVVPSFDCAAASSANEKLICSDQELAQLDKALEGLYLDAKRKAPDPTSFRRESVAAFKQRESNCSDKPCLMSWYDQRRHQLQAGLKRDGSALGR